MTSLVWLSCRRNRVMVLAARDDRLAPLGNQVLDLGRPQKERRS